MFPEPKPHTNTVSTLIKILIEKGFVDYTLHGRQHEYFPLISKEAYSGKSLKGLMKNYFDGSYRNVVSFLVEKNEMSVEDLEMLYRNLKIKNNGNTTIPWKDAVMLCCYVELLPAFLKR